MKTTYRIKATHKEGGQTVADYSEFVLGEAYGETYTSRRKAEAVVERLQATVAEFDLDPLTRYVIEAI